MWRSLTTAVLASVVVFAMAATSQAGATNRSFKVESSDGTDAGIAFGAGGALLVHTPDGDVNGTYVELGLGIIVDSTVFGFANDNGYVGFFTARVADKTPLVGGTATIRGTLVGTTGVVTFVGRAKN